jgi:hypothetical protein
MLGGHAVTDLVEYGVHHLRLHRQHDHRRRSDHRAVVRGDRSAGFSPSAETASGLGSLTVTAPAATSRARSAPFTSAAPIRPTPITPSRAGNRGHQPPGSVC